MLPIFRSGIRSKIVLMMAGTALAAMSVSVVVAYRLASESISELVRTRLESLGESRAAQLGALADSLCSNAVGISRGLSASEAVVAFSSAYAELDDSPLSAEEEGRLREFYATHLGWAPSSRESRPGPDTAAARRLQLMYCMNPDRDARVACVDSGAATAYDVAHARYHPLLREILGSFGDYYDMFLVETGTGRVVYTTLKETDFGVSLRSPSLAGSPLALAYRAVDSGGRPVVLTDFTAYGPSDGIPAAFVAAPIVARGVKSGVIVLQLRQEAVHRVVTGAGQWVRDGLGSTGDCVCVGGDGYVRSDSRHFTSDRRAYLAAVRARGGDATELDRSDHRRTTVLNLRMPMGLVSSGGANAVESVDSRGVNCIGVIKQVRFGDAAWRLWLTMDSREAFADVRDLRHALVWGVCFTVTALLIACFYLSRQLVAPIRTLTEAAEAIAHGDERVVVRLDSGDEFGVMGENFNRMVRNLREKTHRIEEKERTKSRFLAGMSHEIRTPLNAILGYSQMLAKDSGLTPRQRMEIDVIGRAGDHLMTIVDDILEMAKMETGTVGLAVTTFDLGRMLESVVGFYRGRAREKGLALSYACGHDLPRCVVSDEAKLRRILSNVLGNAVKFTKSGGIAFTAEVMASPDPRVHLVRFVVKDSGPGVRAEDAPAIFDPFGQGHAGAEQGGTGLGLAISRRYAQLLGGDITHTSPPEGGAVFTLTVRMMRGSVARLAEDASLRHPLRLSPAHAPVRVLIADADAHARERLAASLKTFGFVIREASEGRGACRLFEEWQPMAVVLDLRLPVMDGIDAASAIRAKAPGSNAVIFALVDAGDEGDSAAWLAAGIDDFLRKPFQAEDLIERLGVRLGLEYEYESPVASPPGCRVAELPGDLAESLIRAAREADYETLLHLVDRLADHDKPFADRLRAMVLKFDYDGILALMAPPAEAGVGG